MKHKSNMTFIWHDSAGQGAEITFDTTDKPWPVILPEFFRFLVAAEFIIDPLLFQKMADAAVEVHDESLGLDLSDIRRSIREG